MLKKIDYSIFYKNQLSFQDSLSSVKWDVYISAYGKSDRVEKVYEKVTAKIKKRILIPEYNFDKDDEIPDTDVFKSTEKNEKLLFDEFFKTLDSNLNQMSICLDITGFMRPQFIYLIMHFYKIGIKKFDVLYSEPKDYLFKDETSFSDESIENIRQINNFEGNHITKMDNDILIIGAGYDDRLISGVAENKDKAKKVLIFGFPSLQADMIQHNILRSYKSKESLGFKGLNANNFLNNPNIYYAPANDPFVTANILQKIFHSENSKSEITNLYLSPLSAKPQALGFAIYYIWECIDKPISMIFPFCQKYERVTTTGIGRIWRYVIELP